MSYGVYRINTDELLVGYDDNKNPKWTPADKRDNSTAMHFIDRSSAELECHALEHRGFYVIVETLRDERIKDEW